MIWHIVRYYVTIHQEEFLSGGTQSGPTRLPWTAANLKSAPLRCLQSAFGNTGNLIPSLLQHPSVYLLINQLRALFADQESGSQIRFVSAHIISFDHHLSDPGRLHYSNLYSFQKGPNNKKIFTASFWPRPCLALASTCRLMTSLVTRVIACKTWQPSTA